MKPLTRVQAAQLMGLVHYHRHKAHKYYIPRIRMRRGKFVRAPWILWPHCKPGTHSNRLVGTNQLAVCRY